MSARWQVSARDLRCLHILQQGRTNSGRQVATATELYAVAPNIFGLSVRNLLHVTILAHRILRWPLELWKICTQLVCGRYAVLPQ
jgi:hypothetical protein